MKNTVSVKLKNEYALNLLYDLEKMDILQVLREPELEKNFSIESLIADSGKELSENVKLSDKLKELLTNEQGLDLKRHVEEMRNEWNDIL